MVCKELNNKTNIDLRRVCWRIHVSPSLQYDMKQILWQVISAVTHFFPIAKPSSFQLALHFLFCPVLIRHQQYQQWGAPQSVTNSKGWNIVLRIVSYRIFNKFDKCLYSWGRPPFMNWILRGSFRCLCCTINLILYQSYILPVGAAGSIVK